jgi:hypothetical protein
VKKIIILILFVQFAYSLFSQHEDIERHFKSYKLYNLPYEDFTYYKDTLTDSFFLYTPQQNYSLNPLGLPNLGTAFFSPLFSENKIHEYWFLNNYIPYIQQHDEIIYFDAKKPFTIFKFSGGGKGQEYVRFLHTQNISPTFNFAFNYDIINSDGFYQYSKSKINAISLATAYTKRKYQNHFNFIFNKIQNLENGGLKDIDKYLTSNYSAGTYATQLSQAQNTVSQLGFQFNQEFGFGKYAVDTIIQGKDTSLNKSFDGKFSIIHDLKADRYFRIYQDIPSSYYENTYFDTRNTFDSSGYKTLDNQVLLNFNISPKGKMENFQVLSGIRSYLYNYTIDSSISHLHFSNFLVGNLIIQSQKSYFNFETDYCFIGQDIGEFDIFGEYLLDISNSISWKSGVNYSFKNTEEFIYAYSSNHYIWENDFFKTVILNANTSLNFKELKLSTGLNSNYLKNYIVFNQDALPIQVANANFIADVWLAKRFDLGKFHWFSKLSYQYIKDKSRVPLPDFVAYSSIYFKSPLFKKAMVLQLGFDVKYFSKAYLYAYNPALSVFYLQTESKYGNYPNMAFNLSVLVKRLRGFVRLSNFNSFVMPRNYFVSHKMPDNPFSFNFGIAWEFYD